MRVPPADALTISLRRGDYLHALAILDRAGLPPARALLVRADVLRNTGRPDEAIQLLGAGLQLDRLAPAERTAALRIQGEAHAALGAVVPALQYFDRAVFEADACSDFEQGALACLSRFTLLANSRGTMESLPALEIARRAVMRSGGTQVLASLYARIGQAHAQRGLAAPAIGYLDTSLEILERDNHLGIAAFAALALCGAEFVLGRYRLARRWATKALEAAVEGGLRLTEAAARANLALLEYRLGRNSVARSLCSDLLSEPTLPPLTRGPVLDTLAAVALAECQIEEAGALIAEVHAIIEETGDATFLSVDSAATSAAHAEAVGRPDEAERLLSMGLDKAAMRGDHTSATKLRLLRAELRFAQGHNDGATEDFNVARASQQRSSVEILGLSSRVRAMAFAVRGHLPEAVWAFARATRIFRRGSDRPSLTATARLRKQWLDSPRPVAVPGAARQRRARLVEHVASTVGFLSELAPYPDILAVEATQSMRRLAPSVAVRVSTVAVGGPAVDDAAAIDLGAIGGRRYLLRLDATQATPSHLEVAHLVRSVVRHAVATEEALLRLAQPSLGSAIEEVPAAGTIGIYASPLMKDLLATARQAAKTDLPILILGETGTGKEILATEIHAASRRANDVFIPFNVTAVSRELVESQLFGARKGAFTGATHDTKGLFREAAGGTIFLDEIGEMTLELQPKLLRFVEQGEIQPVGERPQHVDVRIIAATNASLQDLVKQGRFREDLYHRLRVVPLTIPPLRERREEIATLARHFIAKHAEGARRPVPDIAPRALERLVAADWPGNVRQLNNELKRVVALLPDDAAIEVEHLSPELQRPPSPQPLAFDTPTGRMSVNLDRPLDLVLEDVERATLERVMTVCSGNQSEAARRLGITRKGLYLKLKRMGPGPADAVSESP